jgi:RES domain-containing protein
VSRGIGSWIVIDEWFVELRKRFLVSSCQSLLIFVLRGIFLAPSSEGVWHFLAFIHEIDEMILHPERMALSKRLADKWSELVTNFSGKVYRFINPIHSDVQEMFAGKGPRYAHGRWLLQGSCEATYTALLPETALAEALASSRYYGFPDTHSAPLVFVAADVKLMHVIDLRDAKIRRRLRTSQSVILATDWRKENRHGLEAITQAWGWAFYESGAEGFITQSACDASGANLIVFPANLKKGSYIRVLSEIVWPR